MTDLGRITIDPATCHGNPVVTGTRVLVANILSDLASGSNIDDVIAEYAVIDREDVLAALEFGSALAQFESFPVEQVS
jgi:uncharacterized protein (DUF433 family)